MGFERRQITEATRKFLGELQLFTNKKVSLCACSQILDRSRFKSVSLSESKNEKFSLTTDSYQAGLEGNEVHTLEATRQNWTVEALHPCNAARRDFLAIEGHWEARSSDDIGPYGLVGLWLVELA